MSAIKLEQGGLCDISVLVGFLFGFQISRYPSLPVAVLALSRTHQNLVIVNTALI